MSPDSLTAPVPASRELKHTYVVSVREHRHTRMLSWAVEADAQRGMPDRTDSSAAREHTGVRTNARLRVKVCSRCSMIGTGLGLECRRLRLPAIRRAGARLAHWVRGCSEKTSVNPSRRMFQLPIKTCASFVSRCETPRISGTTLRPGWLCMRGTGQLPAARPVPVVLSRRAGPWPCAASNRVLPQ